MNFKDFGIREWLVIAGEACYVIMNLYPYNPGHMMVLPFRHTSDYQSLTEQEVREMHRFTAHAVKVSSRCFGLRTPLCHIDAGDCLPFNV